MGERQYPLTDRLLGQNMLDEVGGGLRHASRATARTEAALGFVMADSLVLSRHDLALCLFLGVVQYTGGFVLITLGARYLPAAEVALLSLAETVLAPIWVWLGVGEVPALLTLAGGVIVISAVIAQAVTGMRSQGG